MVTRTQSSDTFQVDPWAHRLGGLVEHRRTFWRRLGRWETRLLSDSLSGIEVEQPIYIAGLARSGSTMLLEVLNWHPDVATHRYRDFPFLDVPYLWNRFLDLVPQRKVQPTERAHGDGILVTSESPEAFEEALWMTFFSQLHEPARSSVLNGDAEHPEFEKAYRDHIRKLLLVRGGRRYAAKGNYNITRMEYLLKMFPDARFLIPVRDPVWHVASLIKQHKLFCRGQVEHPEAVAHLRRVGHFEFGQDRRPINADNQAEVAEIRALWDRGRDVEGWARYWNHAYAFVADRLERNPVLRDAAMVVRHERLCRSPADQVRSIFAHCRLSIPDDVPHRADEGIHFPTYCWPRFSKQELRCLQRCTQATASRLGLECSVRSPQSEDGPADRDARVRGTARRRLSG
jgi:hypothetical protein